MQNFIKIKDKIMYNILSAWFSGNNLEIGIDFKHTIYLYLYSDSLDDI